MQPTALRRIFSLARQHHLNLTQAEALCLLAEHGSITVGALAHELGVSTAAVTHIAEALVKLTFANRRSGMSDRRHIWLDITATGVAALEQISKNGPTLVKSRPYGVVYMT